MYERELNAALEAGLLAGRVLLEGYARGEEAWEKGHDDPLTHADLASDRAISEVLGLHFPDDAVLSEETVSEMRSTGKGEAPGVHAPRAVGGPGSRRRLWIVDPMDGTKEFVARIPEFCVSIALAVAGEPAVGVIVNPSAGEAIWAVAGSGTYQAPIADDAPGTVLDRGRRVAVTGCGRLEDAAVVASRTEISRGQLARFDGWFAELRAAGSIAWKLALIACGRADLNVSVAPKNEWDVCAGDLLVREAGGVYVDFAGSPRVYGQRDTLIEAGMAAGPPSLVAAFRTRATAP